MALSFTRFLKLLLKPDSLTSDQAGSLEVNSSDNKLNYNNGSSRSPVVTEAHTATLVNKTINADSNTITNIEDADIKSGAAIARSKIASGTPNHVVTNDGSGNLSSEAQLAITRGGTGQSTANAAFNALSPTTTKGDVISHNGTINVRVPVGTDSQVLTADSSQASGLTWTNTTVADNSINEDKLTTSVAGDGLSGGNGTPLAVNVDGSTLEINTDTLRVKDLGITTAKLDNSAVTTAKINNAAVTPDKLDATVAGAGLTGGAGLALRLLQYDAVVGTAGQVTAGNATHSTLSGAISAVSSGGSILFLPAVTVTENVTVNKKVSIHGMSHTSVLSGNITFDSSSDFSSLERMKITGSVTLDSGADGIFVTDSWVSSSSTITDNGTANYIELIQE